MYGTQLVNLSTRNATQKSVMITALNKVWDERPRSQLGDLMLEVISTAEHRVHLSRPFHGRDVRSLVPQNDGRAGPREKVGGVDGRRGEGVAAASAAA